MVKVHPSAVNSRVDLVDFCPSFFAVWTQMNLLPSTVTIESTSLPSGVVSSNFSPTLNFSSMAFNIVDVLMVHSPPSSVTSITGVDAVAAFLRGKLLKDFGGHKVCRGGRGLSGTRATDPILESQ